MARGSKDKAALLLLAGLGAAAGLVGTAGAADAIGGNCSQSGSTISCTYIYAGAEQQFVIPAGVSSLAITATGGRGGSVPNGASGGYGAVVSGSYTVPAGVTALYVEVGGAADPECATNGSFNCDSAFNGGGTAYIAGAGGGASDVRTVPTPVGTDPSSDETSLNSRLIVAGGGGGAGGEPGLCQAGNGGDGAQMGGNGQVCQGTSAGTGGGAGTSSAGGAGGFGDREGGSGPEQADNGSYGHGGAGGGNQGGGGGGGLYGGGGGGNYRYDMSTGGAGGGGGGSNLVPTGGTSGTDTTGISEVVFSYQDSTVPPTHPATISGQPPAGTAHQAYSYTFRTGGTPPPSVSQTSGTLPPGLALDSQGKLSGTPTKVGTFTFTVRATNSAGSESETVHLTIRGNPVIRIAGSNVTEGNTGSHALVFRLTLSHSSPNAVSVQYATANGSASTPSDYVAKSGSLTFSPGQTTKTVGVTVKGDRVREPNEVFYLLLRNPVAATIGTSSAPGGIFNDD